MAIETNCPACKKPFTVETRLRGKLVTCPSCESSVLISKQLGDDPDTVFDAIPMRGMAWTGAALAGLVLGVQIFFVMNGLGASFLWHSFAACWMFSVLAVLFEIRDRLPPSR